MGRRRNGNQGRGARKKGSKSSSQNKDDILSKLVDIAIDIPLEYDIGTRVEFPSLKGYDDDDIDDDEDGDGTPRTGTVAGHWVRRDAWPKGMKAPYLVMLDDGMAIYCHRTDEDFIRRSDVPPMKLTFNVGARVECLLDLEQGDTTDNEKWFPGTVLETHEDFQLDPINNPPYMIKYDYGRERPFWGPAKSIRASKVIKKGKDEVLRFSLGDRVDCMVGDEEWLSGQVVRLWYREDTFEDGYVVPYQVLLDAGNLIFAPTDEDYCIRKSRPKPLRFCVGEFVECKVDGDWVRGMVEKSTIEKSLMKASRIK